jgi:hypothetical protein
LTKEAAIEATLHIKTTTTTAAISTFKPHGYAKVEIGQCGL